ncbi:MAG: hypothetical protein CUN55_10975 [Phototrophicales bacterium]|nr:MAG: hypothetical protein CUN55_10975 [Phototrophicales bacterium]
MKKITLILILLTVGALYTPVNAQTELAAVLEVIEAGVEVQRDGTSNFIPVTRESIVGINDIVRTNSTGQARITFFETGTEIELTPNTTFRINEYSGDETNGYTTSLEVLAGITRQQVQRFIDAKSSFEVITPGIEMTVRGTTFMVRVEGDGRSALITQEGEVAASAQDKQVPIEAGFGVRAEAAGELSAVVPATTFEELDAGLDGFAATFKNDGDVRLNVRLAPSREAERVGSIPPEQITAVYGVDESGLWYRIAFRNSFGWVYAETFEIDLPDDVTLPIYPADFSEDITSYDYLGDTSADAVVSGRLVNLRAAPDLEADIVLQLADGDVLSVLGRSPDREWLRVQRITDGALGWVNASLVRLNIEIEEIPIIRPVEPQATEQSSSDAAG